MVLVGIMMSEEEEEEEVKVEEVIASSRSRIDRVIQSHWNADF